MALQVGLGLEPSGAESASKGSLIGVSPLMGDEFTVVGELEATDLTDERFLLFVLQRVVDNLCHSSHKLFRAQLAAEFLLPVGNF